MSATTTTDARAIHAHRIGPNGLVEIRIDRGEIVLRGVTGDTVSVRSLAGRSLERVRVDAGDGSLSIVEASDSERGRGGAVKLVADVPAGATVVVEAETADLSIAGLEGEQRYRTASGDIVVRGGAGTLTLEAVSGDVDIAIAGTATLGARTVSGDVNVEAAHLTGLRATTTSGDLRIAASLHGDGPFSVETVSGDTILEARADVRIDAHSISGDIGGDRAVRREGPDGRRLVLGDAGPTVSVRSTSGDVYLADHRAMPSGAQAHRPLGAPPDPPPDPPADPSIAPTMERTPDLDILRALERGEIGVEEAGRRLTALEAGGDHA